MRSGLPNGDKISQKLCLVALFCCEYGRSWRSGDGLSPRPSLQTSQSNDENIGDIIDNETWLNFSFGVKEGLLDWDWLAINQQEWPAKTGLGSAQ